MTVVNIYTSNFEAPKYIYSKCKQNQREKLTKIIRADLNTPFSIMNRSYRQSYEGNNKHGIMDKMDLYKTLHPITTKYTFFSNTHRTFSTQGHMLGHKASLTNLILITYHVFFSYHNDIKLEINNKRIFLKFNNMWKLKSTQTKNMLKKKKDLNKDIKRYHS